MGENVCCPLLRIVDCSDTDEHAHLFCDTQYTIKEIIVSNDWVKEFCLGEFAKCKCYPRRE